MKTLRKMTLGLAALFTTHLTLVAQPALSDTLYVAASALNLREQPHANAAILAVVEYGEAINLLETSAHETSGYNGEWVEVKYGAYSGYMNSDYLTTGYELLMPWAPAPAYLPNLNWYAVFSTDGGDSLRRVELQVEIDPELGNFVTVREPYKYGAFMIIGSIHPLPEGQVSSNPDLCPQTEALYPGMSRPIYWADPTATEQYQLNVFGTYTTNQEGYPMFLDYRIQVSCYSFNTLSSCDQIIFTVPEEQAFWEPVYLLWEGDLNQDGWPDFILMDNQSDFSGTYNLYLGQAPEAGKVVRKVASFEEWDRC